MQPATAGVTRLVDRRPQLGPDRLLAELVPPPRFAGVSFDSYVPDPAQPSQGKAVQALRGFSERLDGEAAPRSRLASWLGVRRGGDRQGRSGVYLDGGFGVGKTHLLASLWHAVDGERRFGTFVEYTNLVGALGFRPAVDALSGSRLVCIDEFELDDPGDTVLMARLLRELVDAGVALAATSNTLPDALGEGRFAADDFLREIQSVAAQFDVVRVDGEDYRHRGLPDPPAPSDDEALVAAATAAGPAAALDEFGPLLDHLASVHPSRYGAMLDGVEAVFWRGVTTVTDQAVALRLVVLADRLYDRDLPLVTSGAPLDALFSAEMLRGGYRKKYRRAISRLTALAREGHGDTARGLG